MRGPASGDWAQAEAAHRAIKGMTIREAIVEILPHSYQEGDSASSALPPPEADTSSAM